MPYASLDIENIYEQTPDDDTSGGRLSRARERAGLTPRDLAWKLGVKLSTVKAWESDRSTPNSHRLATVAGLLNVSLSWILHGVGTGPNVHDDTSSADALSARLDRLKDLHVRTATMIDLIEKDIGRLAVTAAEAARDNRTTIG